MKLSELIKELQDVKAEIGDVEVLSTDEHGSLNIIESVKTSVNKKMVIIDTVDDLPRRGPFKPSITGKELGEMGCIPGVTEEDVEDFLRNIRG